MQRTLATRRWRDAKDRVGQFHPRRCHVITGGLLRVITGAVRTNNRNYTLSRFTFVELLELTNLILAMMESTSTKPKAYSTSYFLPFVT